MMDTPEIPALNTLVDCYNQLLAEGFVDNFSVIQEKLHSFLTGHDYGAHEVQILNFYRFEGQNDPDDSAILYAIETKDGSKGCLVDGYGPSSDAATGQFIVNVKEINKKVSG